jgi:hypothetical protein
LFTVSGAAVSEHLLKRGCACRQSVHWTSG